MATKKQPVKRNTATVTITAEFELDSVDLFTALDDIRQAAEQLQCNGGVLTGAKLYIPEMNLNLEDLN